MGIVNYFFIFYAVFLLIGGVIGYKKAGSKASLIAGIVCGFFIGIGVYIGSLVFIMAVSGVMVIVFGIRLKKTKKFMPAGMLLLLSIVAVLISGSLWLN